MTIQAFIENRLKSCVFKPSTHIAEVVKISDDILDDVLSNFQISSKEDYILVRKQIKESVFMRMVS